MDTTVGTVRPGFVAKVLAVVSLGVFWLLPFSPWVSIAAVWTTRKSSGWARRVAVTGAVLCIAWTSALALLTASSLTVLLMFLNR